MQKKWSQLLLRYAVYGVIYSLNVFFAWSNGKMNTRRSTETYEKIFAKVEAMTLQRRFVKCNIIILRCAQKPKTDYKTFVDSPIS